MNFEPSNSVCGTYWFVGAMYNRTEDQTERFIRDGIWENGYDDKYLALVKSIKVGDRIAIKSSYTRKHGLTFDNRGLTVSVMAIKMIGTVTDNLGDGHTVKVDWQPVTPPREWYFYTNRSTIWRVVPGEWANDALIAFAFYHQDQSIDIFRNAPYWRQRFGDWAHQMAATSESEYLETKGVTSQVHSYELPQKSIVEEIPPDSSICILTGPNGSGKTRALADISRRILDNSRQRLIECNRVICLSGTVLDKFPRPSLKNDHYAYFGRKTNNNMFSEIAPFRRLCPYLLSSTGDRHRRTAIAAGILQSIGISPSITLHFRSGQGSSSSSDPSNFAFNIDLCLDKQFISYNSAEIDAVLHGTVHLESISFEKTREKVQLVDLSSGERAYVLTILVLAFVTINNTFIFFDEPENSLHPKWQSSIVSDMWKAISAVSVNSHAIIATHSPLIVSGAAGSSSFICDLQSNKQWIQSQMYGKTSDCILKEQFNLMSPRSISAIIAIQNTLSAATTIESDPEKFRVASDNLLGLDIQFDIDDPLYQTIKTIKELRGAME
jgi:energy-coupling factor transporter ATP-binding protein EcfA2